MKLKTIFTLACTAMCIFAFAQDLTIKAGPQYKTCKPSDNPSAVILYIDSKDEVHTAFSSGYSELEKVTIISYDDNLKPTTTKEVQVDKLIGQKLKNGGIAEFNGNIVCWGLDKNAAKEWKYQVYAIAQDGSIDKSKMIALKGEYKVQLGMVSEFLTSGFAKSDNGEFGAVYYVYTGLKNERILSVVVFNKALEKVSSAQVTLTGYAARTTVWNALLDNEGNLIGVLNERSTIGGKFSPDAYTFTLLKNENEIKLAELPGNHWYQALDIIAIGDNEYRIFGIYKDAKAKKGQIDGSATFTTDINGSVEAGTALHSIDKYNIFSKSKVELMRTDVPLEYRSLPPISTNDGGTVFFFQKKSLAAGQVVGSGMAYSYGHCMDLYVTKFDAKGNLEWDVRIPAYTINRPNFPVYYDEKSGNLVIVYECSAGHKFESQEGNTEIENIDMPKGKIYVVTIDAKGEVTAGDETKEAYENGTQYVMDGNVIYVRAGMGGFQEKMRRIEIGK